MTKVILPPINHKFVDGSGQADKEWYDKLKFLETLQPLSDIVFPASGVTSLGGSSGAITLDSNFTIPGNALTLSAAVVAGAVSSSSPSAGVGYATGAGGTVTQATSKSTGVTLNKVCGAITMNNAALGGSATVSFTFTNSAIAATDVIAVCISSAVVTSGSYILMVDSVSAGSCRITLRSISAGSLSEAVVINFVVIKGVTS